MFLHLFRWLQNVPWIVTVNSSAGIVSIVWLVHYLGFFLIVGTMVVVNLRVLGLAAAGLDMGRLAGQLAPWTWTGILMAVLSGFIMFAGQAAVLYDETVFHIKLYVLLAALIAGVAVLRKVPGWSRLERVPGTAKLLAAASLVLWIGAILASLEVPAFIPI